MRLRPTSHERPPASRLPRVDPSGAGVCAALLAAVMLLAVPAVARCQSATAPLPRVVMLGTGTPFADPDRSGPSVAVTMDSNVYLFDAGPGVVRRAEAARRAGATALRPDAITHVFLTHLHSDHTLGLADVIFSNWVLGREAPLEIYGPPGTRAMVGHLLAAYARDADVRSTGLELLSRVGLRVHAHDIKVGEVHRDSLVRVRAFAVPHGAWPVAFGYRIDAGGRSIVISGDTRASDAVVAACSSCDLLVHEVYSAERLAKREVRWQRYHTSAHTSDAALGELAHRAGAHALVLYHQLYFGATDDDLIRAVRHTYAGPVTSARDLDVFTP